MNKMFKKLFYTLFPALIISSVLCGCQSAPYTGRSQFIVVGQEDEKEMGIKEWQKVVHDEKPSYDLMCNQALQRVGTSIAAASGRPDMAWEFRVFESKEMNAFCLPGGKVAVYTPIFTVADNDAELAAVVGHEIGHALARHGAERISQEYAEELGISLVGIGTGSELCGQAFGLITTTGLILPYSRTHEYEADYIGLILMAQAGYDPNMAISFWQKFKLVANNKSIFGDFLSTHPLSDKRLQKLQEKLPEAMSIYLRREPKLGAGIRYR